LLLFAELLLSGQKFQLLDLPATTIWPTIQCAASPKRARGARFFKPAHGGGDMTSPPL